MMDPAAEIPHTQLVDPTLGVARADFAKRPRTQADPVSKVLDDDDLIVEIIIRLGFPTTLVRATLVCKRWFHHASDLTFLRRFRKLHLPRLLGFYVNMWQEDCPFARFVPMLPQPPELASVIQCASFNIETYKSFVSDGLNSNVFIKKCIPETRSASVSHSPLCPERGMVIVPPFSYNQFKIQDGSICIFNEPQLKEGDKDLSHVCVVMESPEGTNFMLHVYMVQDGIWAKQTSAMMQLRWLPRYLNPCLVGNKIYVATTLSEILVFDLTTLSYFMIQLPQGLVIDGKRTMLSRADDDSGAYLIHLDNKLQLCIWLYKGDNWLLVDTIHLHAMCVNLRMSDHTLRDEYTTDLKIASRVGGSAEFLLLLMGRCILYLDIKCRALFKVHEFTGKDIRVYNICPFMMIWPPAFPALKDDPARAST